MDLIHSHANFCGSLSLTNLRIQLMTDFHRSNVCNIRGALSVFPSLADAVRGSSTVV